MIGPLPGKDAEHGPEDEGEHDEDGGGDEAEVPVLVVLLVVGQQRRHGERDHRHELWYRGEGQRVNPLLSFTNTHRKNKNKTIDTDTEEHRRTHTHTHTRDTLSVTSDTFSRRC